jgi:hypothetical protein
MKRWIIFLFGLPILLFAQHQIGLGIIIGSPTGLTAKFLLAHKSAISLNAGWNFMGDVGVHITGDYQFLFPNVIKSEEGVAIKDLTPYLGIGGRFRVKHKKDGDTNDFHLGVRIGGGLEYFLRPIGIFLELYPVVDLIPATDFDLEGGIGARFYF